MAARLMHRILVDHARKKRADKRGAGATMIIPDDVSPAVAPSVVDILWELSLLVLRDRITLVVSPDQFRARVQGMGIQEAPAHWDSVANRPEDLRASSVAHRTRRR
jgi:ECF sigma factor